MYRYSSSYGQLSFPCYSSFIDPPVLGLGHVAVNHKRCSLILKVKAPRHDPFLLSSTQGSCQLVVDLLEWKRRCEMKLEVNATFDEMILVTNLSPALYTFSPFALSSACFGRGCGLALTVAKTAPKAMTANMESFILSPTGENFPSSVKTLGPRRRVLDMHYLWS